MLQLTWDTNCLISLESDEPCRAADKAALLDLLAVHDQGRINIRLAAGTAAEKQRDGTYLEHMNWFQERRTAAGLGHLEVLMAPGRYDMSFFDNAVFCGEDDEQQIQDMYAIMFPSKDYDPPDAAVLSSVEGQAWRNRIIDVDMYWSHVHFAGDLFVTNNSKDFIRGGRRDRLLAFGGSAIEVPTAAAEWVRNRSTTRTLEVEVSSSSQTGQSARHQCCDDSQNPA